MSEENLNQQEEVKKTNPNDGSESEEAEVDFENLFGADDEAQEDENPDDKVARLEKTVADLKKGISKAFSQKGREEKSKQEESKTEDKSESRKDDDLTELFFAQVPNAELVDSDLQAVADAKYNGSILKAWKNEKWLQDKANSLSEAKKNEEESKSKISKPSSTTGGRIDFSNVKTAEDYKRLTKDQREQYRKLQAERETD